jgi:hypothetical protein
MRGRERCNDFDLRSVSTGFLEVFFNSHIHGQVLCPGSDLRAVRYGTHLPRLLQPKREATMQTRMRKPR